MPTARESTLVVERVDPPVDVPHKGYLLWVPGVGVADSTAFRGYMRGLAPFGYSSVAMRLEKHACSSPGALVDQIEAAAATLPEPPILVGHSFGGALVQVALARRRTARSSSTVVLTRGVLLCSAPVTSTLPFVWYLLRLLCVAPVGMLLSVLTLNPAFLVGGGWGCRSAARLRYIGFAAAAAETLTVRGHAEPFETFHADVSRVDSFLMVLAFLIFPCRFRRPPDARVCIIGTRDDRIATPSALAATGRDWGVEPRVLSGLGHFLADPGWESTALPALVIELEGLRR